jgi:CDP-diacylglycerol---serine O-phosphatidyltransferase
MTDSKKIAFFLPNSFTAFNMACGFMSIIYSTRGNFKLASLALIIGAIFDSVDGRVARFFDVESSFGEQFDSLSDVISFGLAPAILLYHRFFMTHGRAGLFVSFIYLLCGALRLARFNANIDKVKSDYFQGLPIPGAAWGIIGLVLLSLEFEIPENFWPFIFIYVLFYAALMISTIPFCSFKNSPWVKTYRKLIFLLMIVILWLAFNFDQIMIFVLITTYVVGSLIYFFSHKGELNDVFSWKSEKE